MAAQPGGVHTANELKHAKCYRPPAGKSPAA